MSFIDYLVETPINIGELGMFQSRKEFIAKETSSKLAITDVLFGKYKYIIKNNMIYVYSDSL